NRMRVNANLYYTGKQYFCLQEKHEEVFLIDDEYVTKILDDEVEKIDPVFLVNPSINLTFGNLQIDIQVHKSSTTNTHWAAGATVLSSKKVCG
ncbi:MAG: hypothetical protein IIT83_01820, partial [Bacteroidales bacterium]|nr:hypothetical protein [Bacteroidales bacterium]